MLVKSNIFFPYFFAILITTGLLFSCKKDPDNQNTSIPEQPDLSTKIVSSVSGFVTNENNAPIPGASVNLGNGITTTNQYGYFEIKNAEVIKTAAVVVIAKAGYFKSVKTYSAISGKSAFFRVKLIPNILSGTINTSSGGNVTLTNGLTIAIPANSVVNATDNTIYSGIVNVAACWIDPTAEYFNQYRPGDQRGLDKEGSLQGLKTFGMMAVEITGASGELLQIAPGKKATLTIPFPASYSSVAPSTVPLWYFDENNGLWKEDGSAVKTGNLYVGDVSHFSSWSSNLPDAIIPVTFTVVDAAGIPLGNACVNIYTSLNFGGCSGYTDQSGFVNAFVTANTQYNLTILGFDPTYAAGNFCEIYSQSFSVNNTALDLGNIVISNSNIATVTGTISDCNGNPVTNGSVTVHHGWYETYPVDNTGTYLFTTPICNSITNAFAIGENNNTNQQSIVMPFTIVSGTNYVSNLQACGLSTDQYINFIIDGTSYSYTWPADYVGYGYQNLPVGPTLFLSGYNNSTSDQFHFNITRTGIGLNSVQQLVYFTGTQLTDSINFSNPLPVNIVEYSTNVGEYIAGNFSGPLPGGLPPYTSHNIACSFRLKNN